MSDENKARSSLFGVLFVPALILGALIIVALLVLSFRGGSETAQRPGNDRSRQIDSSILAKFRNQYDKLGEADGNANAPITIREFGDYQCPACGAFAPTARKVRENLVASGKARFIFFDFPLPMHAHSHEAALAARCAARQNKFWPYHDKLYETQREWAEKDDPEPVFLDLAVETGVNSGQLKQCIDQAATAQVIEQSRAAGKAVRLRATPTVIVGDTLYSGAIGYDKIKQKVEAATANGAG